MLIATDAFVQINQLPEFDRRQIDSQPQPISAISGAPFGSSLACIISYAYIRMLGAEGLKMLY